MRRLIRELVFFGLIFVAVLSSRDCGAQALGASFSMPFVKIVGVQNADIECGGFSPMYRAEVFYQKRLKRGGYKVGLTYDAGSLSPILNGLRFGSDVLAGTVSSMHQDIRFNKIGIEALIIPILIKSGNFELSCRTGFGVAVVNTRSKKSEVWYGTGGKEVFNGYPFTEIKKFNMMYVLGLSADWKYARNTFQVGCMTGLDLFKDEYFMFRSKGRKLYLGPFLTYSRLLSIN